MLKLNQQVTPVQNFETLYNSFAQKCLNKNSNLDATKKDFLKLQDKFVKNRQINTLCDKTDNLSRCLMKRGNKELANILMSEIGKCHMHFRNYEAAEPYIKKALDISREMNDNFHVLARLNDLQEIYSNLHDRRSYFNVLCDKKDCLKNLIEHYDENLNNYHTLHRSPTSLASIKIQLAYNYSAVSELLWFNKPKNCLRAVMKAREIYQELGKDKEVKYLDEKIRRLQKRLQGNSQTNQACTQ